MTASDQGWILPARRGLGRSLGPHLGLLALVLAAGGILSGVFLGFQYAPTLDAAHDSISFLQDGTDHGSFLRAVHHWSGTLALVFALLHGLRRFWQGSYQRPRRRVWVLSALIGLVLLGFSYTGYLLPGDERAFTGMEVLRGVAASTPGVGREAALLVAGGEAISSATLVRVYTMHVVVLPALLVGLLAGLLVALFGAARKAGPAHRQDDQTRETENENDAETEPQPARGRDLAIQIGWTIVALALVALLASRWPPELGPKADPLGGGAPDSRPEWFFLWVNQLLRYAPGNTFLVGAVLPGLLALLVLALPWIARGEQRAPSKRKPELIAAGVMGAALATLTALALAEKPAETEQKPIPADPDQEGAGESPADFEARVQAVLDRFKCGKCHRIDGDAESEDTAPRLSRDESFKLYTREYFRRKVGDPLAFWPDTQMVYSPRRLKPTPKQLDDLERWFFGQEGGKEGD